MKNKRSSIKAAEPVAISITDHLETEHQPYTTREGEKLLGGAATDEHPLSLREGGTAPQGKRVHKVDFNFDTGS